MPLLDVRNLVKHFTRGHGLFRQPSVVKAVDAVSFSIDEGEMFGLVVKGEIQSLDARVAQDTRTLLVRGILPNKERKLLPGMFANVTVLVGEPADVVTVPRTAVTYSLYGDSVYVVQPAPPPKDGKAPAAGTPAASGEPPLIAERRFVRTGQVRDDRIAITSGLAVDEKVVTTGQIKLNPGVAIRIDNTQPLVRPEERPKQ